MSKDLGGSDGEARIPEHSTTPSRHPPRPDIPPPRRTSSNNIVQQEMTKLPKEIRNIVAGGMAGMVAKSFVAPFDRIKILYQISSARFSITQVPSVAMKIAKTEGVTALWKGNTATMIRVFPYAGIQFMVYDRCKTFLLKEQEIDYARRRALDPDTPKPKWGLTPKESLFSGMLAGLISVVCTYPLDLTRAQLAVLRRQKDPSANMSFFRVISDNYLNRVRARKWKHQYHYVFNDDSDQINFFAFSKGRDWTFSGDNADRAWSVTILWDCLFVQRTSQTKGM